MRTRNGCSGQRKGEMAICKLGFVIKVSEEYIASIPLWPPPLWKVGVNDNRAENLEWVTSSENHQHAHDVLLLEVKPVALLDERGHLQWLFHSARACNRAMGGKVSNHIINKCNFHGYRPRYISVAMYREIVHLVNVHHYTLHSAWIEANISLSDSSNGSNGSMQQSCGSNDNQSTMQPAVGADSRVCPNNTQPATQTGEANHNYQLSTINYQLSDEA